MRPCLSLSSIVPECSLPTTPWLLSLVFHCAVLPPAPRWTEPPWSRYQSMRTLFLPRWDGSQLANLVPSSDLSTNAASWGHLSWPHRQHYSWDTALEEVAQVVALPLGLLLPWPLPLFFLWLLLSLHLSILNLLSICWINVLERQP